MKTYEDEAMTPGMVAELFKVSARTVVRWAKEGHLRYYTTPGGHTRFQKKHVDALLKERGYG